MKRLLTIGHSYVVAQNRRLAHEMAIQGHGRWEVTAVAPEQFAGDLRDIAVERIDGEACRLVTRPLHLASKPHVMLYSGLRQVFGQHWDVVHCWEEPYVAVGYQIARQAPATSRFVFATFQNIAKRYPPPFNWFERRVVKRANGWIAFGETIAETQARRPGYDAVPSRVISPGVDAEQFSPDSRVRTRIRERFGWDDSLPVVGFLGRFVPAKGVRLLVEVLTSIRSPWRALFVGNGSERAHLEQFASAHPGRVAIATNVNHDAVPGYLNAMDLLCAPSQTTAGWREQFGRMSIEAMACGVAVIGSDSGEIPHVIGDAGIVVRESDRHAWSRAIDSLLQDEPRRRRLAAAGRERAQAQFAWPVVARRHLDFFDELTA